MRHRTYRPPQTLKELRKVHEAAERGEVLRFPNRRVNPFVASGMAAVLFAGTAVGAVLLDGSPARPSHAKTVECTNLGSFVVTNTQVGELIGRDGQAVEARAWQQIGGRIIRSVKTTGLSERGGTVLLATEANQSPKETLFEADRIAAALDNAAKSHLSVLHAEIGGIASGVIPTPPGEGDRGATMWFYQLDRQLPPQETAVTMDSQAFDNPLQASDCPSW